MPSSLTTTASKPASLSCSGNPPMHQHTSCGIQRCIGIIPHFSVAYSSLSQICLDLIASFWPPVLHLRCNWAHHKVNWSHRSFTVLLCPVRILQSKQGKVPGTNKSAAEVAASVAQLHDSFVVRGIFRQFLDTCLVSGGQVAEACGSSSFLSALSTIIR